MKLWLDLIKTPFKDTGQWENEIKRCCKNPLSVVIFHGPDRKKLAAKLHQYDIVITTHQIVLREISKVSIDKKDGANRPIGDFETRANEFRQSSALLQIVFNRIILDDAHVIRNPTSGVSQAVCRLCAARRWAVTGTPVQNKELDITWWLTPSRDRSSLRRKIHDPKATGITFGSSQTSYILMSGC